MDNWKPYPQIKPTKDGNYLVTRLIINNQRVIDILSWGHNLRGIDEYDFIDKNRCGWYEYDSEWGYYEIDNIVGWMELPEPYGGKYTHE